MGVVSTVGALPGTDSIQPPDQLPAEVTPGGVMSANLTIDVFMLAQHQMPYFDPVVTSAGALLLPRFNKVNHLDSLAQAGSGGQAA